jgi:type II secretory pathway pseudopilin PulG
MTAARLRLPSSAASAWEGRRTQRGAFTLVELLVVIGILILLASILLPIVFGVRKNAMNARIKLDLQAIATGLEEYKKVFRDYPRQSTPNPASAGKREELLVTYLIGEKGDGVRLANTGDNKDTQGAKKWGPFVPPEKFKVVNGKLTDSSGKEVMYYPRYNAYDKRPLSPGNKYSGFLLGNVLVTAISPKAMFNVNDGIYIDDSPATVAAKDHVEHVLFTLGDGSDQYVLAGPGVQNNKLEGAETLKFDGPFLLVSPGADGQWGLIDDGAGNKAYKQFTKADDVYNF